VHADRLCGLTEVRLPGRRPGAAPEEFDVYTLVAPSAVVGWSRSLFDHEPEPALGIAVVTCASWSFSSVRRRGRRAGRGAQQHRSASRTMAGSGVDWSWVASSMSTRDVGRRETTGW